MRFRKRPVEIEAVQWRGDNRSDISTFMPGVGFTFEASGSLTIHTLEGDMEAAPGDWIICGVQGEHYPCKSDIFEETYERA